MKTAMKRRIQAINNFPQFFINFGRRSAVIRKLFFSNRGEHPILKGCTGFLFGIILGMLFYQIVIKQLEFSYLTTLVLTLVIVLVLAFGCSISSQLRCTCILTVPAFCGRTGRAALKALVIAYILAGPVHNLIVNTKEVIRTFACTTTLTYNLTKTRYVLMFKPFKDALMSVKADTSEVRETLNTVQEVAAPIANEFTNDDEIKYSKELNDYIDELQNETKRSHLLEIKYNTKKEKNKDKKIEQDYFKKLEYRCEGVMSAAGSKCRKIFAKAYDDCYDTVSWMAAWALCWPMKLTFVCDVAKVLGGSDACDATNQMTPGFGKAYNYLINSRNMVASEFRPARIQYRLPKPKVPINVRGVEDSAKAIIREFEQKKSFLDSVMVIVKRILSLIFVRIIINAQSYQEGYIKDIEYDNIYITRYFRKIDARRRLHDKNTLLPLMKLEKPKFIDPYDTKLFKREKSHILGQTIKICLEMVTASAIVLIDRIFYESLDIVRRHGKIEYHQSGFHDLSVTVKGTGMIASVVRSIIKNFNFHKKINQNYTNEYCLPRPKLLLVKDIKTIYGIYGVIFTLIIVEGYIQRTRFIICAYFYPKREKKRTLYLYNKTLKQRIGFYKYMKKKLKKMVKDNKLDQDFNYLLLLKMKFPRYMGWLGWFEQCRRKCLICGEAESRKEEDRHECGSCLYIYCLECWKDIGELCYVCHPSTSADEDSAEEPEAPDR